MDGEPVSLSEMAVCRAWHDGRIAGCLHAVDGARYRVVHRGTWSHGLGPDFRDAMVERDGHALLTGSIEMHLVTSGWRDHGHHLDPRYNDVILHLVVRHDGAETRRADGALVPVVELHDVVAVPQDHPSARGEWGRFGGEVCAADLAQRRPSSIREVLQRLGDQRLAVKTARFEARLTQTPPGEALYQDLWDGLGFSANRDSMRALAERLPLAAIEAVLATARPDRRLPLAQALLFGIAGFLPLSPGDAHHAGIPMEAARAIDALWQARGQPWHDQALRPTAWVRAGVRPANHPARRLAAGAAILARSRAGLMADLLEPLRHRQDASERLRALACLDGTSLIGPDRARSLTGNVLIPFALALASHTGDGDLHDASAHAWSRLPAADANQITRRAQRQVAGSVRLAQPGFRGQQGLIHLDQTLCAPRRCYECPVAALVLAASDPAP